MARIYANLIEKGIKKFPDDVPAKLREQVRQILIDDGYLDE